MKERQTKITEFIPEKERQTTLNEFKLQEVKK